MKDQEPAADLLFAGGPFTPGVAAWREKTAELLTRAFRAYADDVRRDNRIPREFFRELGAAGLFHDRWRGGPGGDPGKAAVLAEESGRQSFASLTGGLGLTTETAPAMLRRYGQSALLQEYLSGLLDGRLVAAVSASEPQGGSDLTNMQTVARKQLGGWRLTGEKKYLSLATICDFALVLCRIDDGRSWPAPRLGVFAVPAGDLTIRKLWTMSGNAGLETAAVGIDAVVPDEARLGRAGSGLVVLTHGLTHERLAIAAQVAGGVANAITLATTHLHRRTQFGRRLIEHQALRLRLADLNARLLTLRYAVYAAAQGVLEGACGYGEAAALKVTAARFGVEAYGECMHVFGGAGYMEDETPMARMWRDARSTRIGGGTDEMMWELVASGMAPDFDRYDECIHIE